MKRFLLVALLFAVPAYADFMTSGGTPGALTGTGTTGLVPDWTSSTALGDSLAYRISVPNDTSTGTTVNKLAKFTSSGKAVITSAAETSGVLGIIHSGAGTSGNAVVTTLGAESCVSDNATTAGHYATVSASTAGSCSDTGSTTFPSAGTQVIGIWTETGTAGSRTMFFNTPDVASASSGGGGGGSKNPAGAAGDVQYRASSNNFAAETNFNYDATNNRLRLSGLTSATDDSVQMVNISGTLPASPSGGTEGVSIVVTSAGSASPSYLIGTDITLAAGYSGASSTTDVQITNVVAGTGATLNLGSGTDPIGNRALRTRSSASGAGYEYGAVFNADGSTVMNVASYDRAIGGAAGTNVGTLGNAANSTEGTNFKNIAGWFTLTTTDPATVADNVSVALVAASDGTADIFRGYSTTTKNFSIAASGNTVTAGTITSTATGTIGWSVQAAANQACTTTCTSACVFGFDTGLGGTDLVDCADATADRCVCAGSS